MKTVDEAGKQLSQTVAQKEARKLKARREGHRNAWFGLGMFGVIGWSVALPTVLGIALGLWIDRTWPSQFSWTLMLMFVGVVFGCWNAWRWIVRERETIEREGEEKQ
jgi:ATP synthase protein I